MYHISRQRPLEAQLQRLSVFLEQVIGEYHNLSYHCFSGYCRHVSVLDSKS